MIRLKRELILMVHEELLREYGGQPGFIDQNVFESQCEMPYQTFGGMELFPTLYDKAVRYLFGFATNQAFCDGNKRIAVASMLIFLDLNGIMLNASHDELTQLCLDVANKLIDEDQAKQFLIDHTI